MNSLRTGSECVIPAWVGVDQDMAALRRIVCETLHIPDSTVDQLSRLGSSNVLAMAVCILSHSPALAASSLAWLPP